MHDQTGSEDQVRSGDRRLRADACRNRDAILAAAKEVFAEHGLEASLEDIAAKAKVGIATLYRRFPSRQHLVAAALIEKVAKYAEAAESALAISDPWTAFTSYVNTICELQAGDRGMADLISMTLPADEHVERLRRAAHDHVSKLIDRAKAARPAAQRLRQRGPDPAADRQRRDRDCDPLAGTGLVPRLVALVLDAFGRTDTPALPAPPSSAEMASAMCGLAAERGCGADNARGLPQKGQLLPL